MAGFMIDNLEHKRFSQWHLEDLKNIQKNDDAQLLDMRTPEEYAEGHIPGFKNIPVDVLRDHLHELDPQKPIFALCQSGLRSYLGARLLEENGFEVYSLSGGFRFYDAVFNDRCLIEKAFACGMDQVSVSES